MNDSFLLAQESYFRELAELPFPQGYPASESVEPLQRELHFQLAVQTYLWALPAMSLYSMRKALEAAFGAGSNVLVMWKDRVDAKTIMVAPNPDVIYGFAWLDLKRDGPTVVDVPPQVEGLMDDAWQRPLTDFGFFGPDRGTGGKYLVLPPHYKGDLPMCYHIVRSSTYGVFVLFRAFLEDGHTTQGVALLEKSHIYPLARRGNPPAMEFPNASGVSIDMGCPRDASFFENLARLFEEDAPPPEDSYMRALAANLGIGKSKHFKPDEAQRVLLHRAAVVAYKISAMESYVDFPDSRTYPDRRWRTISGIPRTVFEPEPHGAQELSGELFQSTYATGVGMTVAMPGKGAQYLRSTVDSEGKPLRGELTYKLHLPAPVPAANYWSVVAYDADTRALLNNGQRFPSISSTTNFKPSADGSANIYFSPRRPKLAANWIKTVPGRAYFAVIRLYSPTLIFFGKYWKPDDIVRLR